MDHRLLHFLTRMAALRIAVLLALFFAAANAIGAPPAPPTGLLPLSPKPAPALKLKNADGKVVDLVSTRGRWTLVHFWASWCGPCRKEMPTLPILSAKVPDLKLILVNTSETDDEVFSFLATVSPELDSLMDRDGTVTERWKPRGLPSSYLVDPQGQLCYLALGGREWASSVYLQFLNSIVKYKRCAETQRR